MIARARPGGSAGEFIFSEASERGALGIVSAAARLASRINFIENRPLARESSLPSSSRSLVSPHRRLFVVDADARAGGN